MPQRPISSVFFSELPSDPGKRLEALIDVFGEHVFCARNMALRAIALGVRDPASLLPAFAHEYAAVAGLPPEHQQAAIALAEKAADLFLQNLLRLFADRGSTNMLGPSHAVNYAIVLGIRDLRDDDFSVVEQHALDESKKYLPNYYGRWLNRFGQV